MEVHETQKEFKNDIFFLLKYDLEPKTVHNRYTSLEMVHITPNIFGVG